MNTFPQSFVVVVVFVVAAAAASTAAGNSGQGWPCGLLQPAKLPAHVDLVWLCDIAGRQISWNAPASHSAIGQH